MAVIGLALAGCGSTGSLPVQGSAAERFPADTLRDWVSYADHVAVFEVVSQREIPPTQEEIERGEGLVGRAVTLRIERTLWSAEHAPALPTEVHMTALGWVMQNGETRPMAAANATRVAVGQRYVAPLVRVEDGADGPEWWPLGIGAQLPLDGDRVEPVTDGPAQRALAGRDVAAVRSALDDQAPDPEAARYRRLRPTERVRAVLRERSEP